MHRDCGEADDTTGDEQWDSLENENENRELSNPLSRGAFAIITIRPPGDGLQNRRRRHDSDAGDVPAEGVAVALALAVRCVASLDGLGGNTFMFQLRAMSNQTNGLAPIDGDSERKGDRSTGLESLTEQLGRSAGPANWGGHTPARAQEPQVEGLQPISAPAEARVVFVTLGATTSRNVRHRPLLPRTQKLPRCDSPAAGFEAILHRSHIFCLPFCEPVLDGFLFCRLRNKVPPRSHVCSSLTRWLPGGKLRPRPPQHSAQASTFSPETPRDDQNPARQYELALIQRSPRTSSANIHRRELGTGSRPACLEHGETILVCQISHIAESARFVMW
ncbi:hypothetical protein B0H67DRAFT_349949 [Lasiosphaeris hirsuta]|uniref:Uncharacterized protein n=1 Tax=Lasiosphaeris hirsuta TaxID=260670 RepID=A0AA39ZVP1_9PEZI|nr:hypothetical protein B0H67DRAFT_349949 [Lasiosphaeris hirsuta]